MPFYVDGNNLAGRVLGRPPASDEERRTIRDRIAARVRKGRSAVVLFFDGEPETGKRDAWLGGLTVRHSGERSADDAIVDAVARAKAPRDCHVVTDDRALGQRVRALGARTLSTVDFWARLEETPGEPSGPADVDLDEWTAYFADDGNRLE